MKKKILVTLATGRTGFAVANQLLEEGYPVRIYVRAYNPKAHELEQKGAEVFTGTLDDADSFSKALSGIDAVYYNYPYKPGMPEDVGLFIQLAQASGIATVVFMGQRLAERHDTGSVLTDGIIKSYDLLEKSGLNVIYFAPGYFADNVFVISEMVLQLGLMPNLYGKGKNPWICIGDMSRCIVALLKNPEPYYGKRLFPTGPESISSEQIASVFSSILGRKIWMFPVPEWMYYKSGMQIGKEYGFDTFAIVQGAIYNRQMKMNHFDIAPTNVVKELTGQAPEDFESIARDYFGRSPYRHKTIINWWKAFVRFNLLPFVRIPSKADRRKLNGALPTA